VLHEVCAAIVEEFGDELLAPPQTVEELRQISDNWMNSWNFPHVIGAIDGKYIACKSPANTSCSHAAVSSSWPGNLAWASSSVP
jgi:hypothetical protein